MAELAALLFDVDGTLADTEEVHRQAFNTSFARAGLDWHWSRDLYAKLLAVSGGKERIRHYVDDFQPNFQRPSDLSGFIADLHQQKTGLYTQTLAEGRVQPRPGVRRLLLEARKEGLRLAIATTTSPANVIALLEHSLNRDSVSWFEVIAAGSDVSDKKPAPDIFDYALQQLDLPASACLAIEDSNNGLRSAQSAGLQTLVTVSTYTANESFDGAIMVLDHLGEPDQPCTVLAGSNGIPGVDACVDVSLLRRLHTDCLPGRETGSNDKD